MLIFIHIFFLILDFLYDFLANLSTWPVILTMRHIIIVMYYFFSYFSHVFYFLRIFLNHKVLTWIFIWIYGGGPLYLNHLSGGFSNAVCFGIIWRTCHYLFLFWVLPLIYLSFDSFDNFPKSCYQHQTQICP